MRRLAPAIVLGIFVLFLAASAFELTTRRSGLDLSGFRRLPVSVAGRVQPIDSVARLGLLQVHGSPALVDLFGSRRAAPTGDEAARWLVEVLASPDSADGRPLFPVEQRELVTRLHLGDGPSNGGYYAFKDFAGHAQEISREATRIQKVKPGDRAPWERELASLQMRLILYERLKNSLQPNSALQREAKGQPLSFDFAGQLARFRKDLSDADKVAERRRQEPTATLDAMTAQRLRDFASLFQPAVRTAIVAAVPPSNAPGAHWRTPGEAIAESARTGRPVAAPVSYLAAISSAYAQHNEAAFNDHVKRYRQWLASNGFGPALRRVAYEVFYNGFQPFIRSIQLYLVAVVLLGLAWRTAQTTIYRSAVAVVVLAFCVHTLGVVLTIELAGRPSLLTIAGWAITLGALVVEPFWRRRIAIGVAVLAALGALIAARLDAAGVASLLQRTLDLQFMIAAAATAVALLVARQRTTTTRTDVTAAAA